MGAAGFNLVTRLVTCPKAPATASTIVCPGCHAKVDVHEVDYRLGERVRQCTRCGLSVPARDDPARDAWTLVVSESAGAEVVCPRCVNLSEVAARAGVARSLP
jgi:DNA replicative helicase MCM subunit Mcm2 (Cdc46/Mcm family)